MSWNTNLSSLLMLAPQVSMLPLSHIGRLCLPYFILLCISQHQISERFSKGYNCLPLVLPSSLHRRSLSMTPAIKSHCCVPVSKQRRHFVLTQVYIHGQQYFHFPLKDVLSLLSCVKYSSLTVSLKHVILNSSR